jgi:hypothetical protein
VRRRLKRQGGAQGLGAPQVAAVEVAGPAEVERYSDGQQEQDRDRAAGHLDEGEQHGKYDEQQDELGDHPGDAVTRG